MGVKSSLVDENNPFKFNRLIDSSEEIIKIDSYERASYKGPFLFDSNGVPYATDAKHFSFGFERDF